MKKVTAVIIVCLILPTMALDLLNLQIVPKVEEVEPAAYDSIDLLAKCVEAEAGNQGLYGKQLVVDVILNRVDSDSFPNTIEEVIKQDEPHRHRKHHRHRWYPSHLLYGPGRNRCRHPDRHIPRHQRPW